MSVEPSRVEPFLRDVRDLLRTVTPDSPEVAARFEKLARDLDRFFAARARSGPDSSSSSRPSTAAPFSDDGTPVGAFRNDEPRPVSVPVVGVDGTRRRIVAAPSSWTRFEGTFDGTRPITPTILTAVDGGKD